MEDIEKTLRYYEGLGAGAVLDKLSRSRRPRTYDAFERLDMTVCVSGRIGQMRLISLVDKLTELRHW